MEQGWPGLAQYVASTPANWTPKPRTVQDALDTLSGLIPIVTTLATPNFVKATGQGGTGTGVITTVTPAISKLRTGQMNVAATISGTTTAGTTVTLQLLRDATPIGAAIVVTTLSAGDGFTGAINAIDTAPDAAAHTYTLTATATAGNITVAGANSSQVQASEQ